MDSIFIRYIRKHILCVLKNEFFVETKFINYVIIQNVIMFLYEFAIFLKKNVIFKLVFLFFILNFKLKKENINEEN